MTQARVLTEFRRNFGARLRRLREAQPLTQHQLADAIEAEHAMISRYERGVRLPNVFTVVRLADVLNVSIGKLLLGQEDDERAIAAAKIRDPALLDRFRDVDRLPANDRLIVARVIDAFIAQHECDHVTIRSHRR